MLVPSCPLVCPSVLLSSPGQGLGAGPGLALDREGRPEPAPSPVTHSSPICKVCWVNDTFCKSLLGLHLRIDWAVMGGGEEERRRGSRQRPAGWQQASQLLRASFCVHPSPGLHPAPSPSTPETFPREGGAGGASPAVSEARGQIMPGL